MFQAGRDYPFFERQITNREVFQTKVAQVSPRFAPFIGGIETHVEEISTRLCNLGVDIEILTTDPSHSLPDEEVIHGIKVRRFKSWAPADSYYFSTTLSRFLKNHSSDYDIVHAHSLHAIPAYYASMSKKRNKLIVTTHYHGGGHTFFRNLLHVPYRFIIRGILVRADEIICVSRSEKDLLTSRFEINNSKIVVIPNGIDLTEFQKLTKNANKSNTILYVGRLEKYKRIDVIVKALKELDDSTRLEIVGAGPYHEKLLTLINRLGLKSRVAIVQDLTREELLTAYGSAGVFVMPSKYEAYGITVAEALAAGTPCIVANNSALSQWIDGKNCVGVENVENIGDVANKIRQSFGKRVEQIPIQDWNNVAKSTLEQYEVVLG